MSRRISWNRRLLVAILLRTGIKLGEMYRWYHWPILLILSPLCTIRTLLGGIVYDWRDPMCLRLCGGTRVSWHALCNLFVPSKEWFRVVEIDDNGYPVVESRLLDG